MDKVQQHSEDIENWLTLARADGVGAVGFSRLLEHFGTVDRVLGASVSELMQVNGIGQKKAEQVFTSRTKFNVKKELDLADKLSVWLLTLADDRYPTLLRRIYDPPAVLYIKGTLSKKDNLSAAIVGSRRCSLYGKEQSSRFAYMLGSAGFTICSGMARGIDTAAHRGALSTGARTIAVQGCGLANRFPRENDKLFEEIAENGACISEVPLEGEPLAENFPPRNRIIAGLSLGTIVVEAAMRSGALITAREALENNREVMAVPGKIDSPMSKGSNHLLKQGATLIESAEDVMNAFGAATEQLKTHVTQQAQRSEREVNMPLFSVSQLDLSNDEKCLYECLSKEPTHIEDIIETSKIGPGRVNAGLIALRLKGLIKQMPGNHFIAK